MTIINGVTVSGAFSSRRTPILQVQPVDQTLCPASTQSWEELLPTYFLLTLQWSEESLIALLWWGGGLPTVTMVTMPKPAQVHLLERRILSSSSL